MYTRSYKDDEAVFSLPDGYGGTALTGDIHKSEMDPPVDEKVMGRVGDGGFLSRLFPSVLSSFNLGEGGFLRGFKLGREEVIIIATALFLFFSDDRDPECAVLLLLLLFIN